LGVALPNDGDFDVKIERVLREAGRPSYRAVDREASISLLKLDRARNSMHDADCFYDSMKTQSRVTAST
jgi:hypothetical protein